MLSRYQYLINIMSIYCQDREEMTLTSYFSKTYRYMNNFLTKLDFSRLFNPQFNRG